VARVPIVPDTKNWTWVLERRCPECGFEAFAFSRGSVGGLIRRNGAQWQPVLALPNVRARPNDDTWSPLEYGCHVRDVYRICLGRLELMLDRDDPEFANWDQDATAESDRYSEQDPAQVAAELFEAAQRYADAYDAVSGEQWARTGSRSDGARFTVESFARYVIHDPVHHLADVGALPD
jgi:hypothetical protein